LSTARSVNGSLPEKLGRNGGEQVSWIASFVKPVPKRQAAAAISALSTGRQTEGPAIDQCELAKHVAHSILPIIPGPFIQVTLSGHANGVGWQKKEGCSNDCISVSVVQITEEPA